MSKKLYNVEKIVDKKKINGKVCYFVQWENYPPSDNTWEPASNLKHLKSMLDEFNKQHAQSNQKIERSSKSCSRSRSRSKSKEKNQEDKQQEKQKQEQESNKNNNKSGDISLKVKRVQKKSCRMSTSCNSDDKGKEEKDESSDSSRSSSSDDDETIENESKTQIGSSFKDTDEPEKIVQAKKEKSGEIKFQVQWKKRQDGVQPENSLISNSDMKSLFPQVLINYYESKVKFVTSSKQ